jgi:putative ABC transport system permease protein
VRVIGIWRVAYKLLTNDKGKFAALLTGITFAVFLMIEMTSMFSGFMRKAASTVTNTGASMWVMDRAVNNVLSSIPMPDYILDAVRSIPGVKYAVPLYSGSGLAKLKSGVYQPVTVIGLDDTSLYGRPELLEGHIEDIYAENGFVVVKDEEMVKLENPTVGTVFEINDNRGVIVGVAHVPASGLFGLPTLYTTYGRAIQYLPNPRFTISYLLVEPQAKANIPAIESEVAKLGYLALTEQEFIDRIIHYYTWHTGLGTNILLMTAISFIIGLSISGQTFYSFTLENLEKFGALKAIGAKRRVLVYMLLFQAGLTAFCGYGLGVGLCTLLIALAKWRLPDYASVITFGNLILALFMVIVIAAVSSYIGVRKVLRIEPFDIFRS